MALVRQGDRNVKRKNVLFIHQPTVIDLLINRSVPVSRVMLTAMIFNIFRIQIFMVPSGLLLNRDYFGIDSM